jgi:hypothetical protein
MSGAVCPNEPPTWPINPNVLHAELPYADPAGRNVGTPQLA